MMTMMKMIMTMILVLVIVFYNTLIKTESLYL